MHLTARVRKLRDLARELRHVRPELAEAREQIAALNTQIAELAAGLESAAAEQAKRDNTLLHAVEFVADQEADTRRRVRAMRETEGYTRPFTEPEPLVSVTIPTYLNHEALTERALPSVMNQTYQNFEVVVVGDCSPPETAEAIEKFGDPRIRYSNLSHRGPYPSDPFAFWMVAGIHPSNAARRLARGSWIAPLNDDDSFREDHIEVLLETARETKCEVAYGSYLQHLKDGSEETLGRFPPELAQFVWQAALIHPDLRFMEYELSCELFGWPGDWSLCRRMLRAGVNFAMVPKIVTDYYPSRSWDEEREALNRLPDRVRDGSG